MVTNSKHHNLLTLLLISFLALSLPLATKLVQRPSDDRSKAAESDIKINFKIAFKGVKPDSICLSSLNNIDLDIVNITKKVYQSQTGISITPITGEINKLGEQIFLISDLVLDNNFKLTDSFNYIQIKKEAYLKPRMCFNNQSLHTTNSSACDLPLTNGATYDFSNYPLIPGDLNQDGIINASDFSIVKYSLNPSADSVCDQQTDLNHDGLINSFDLTYLKKSLLQTDDEVTIDLTTITPTPTASPTPTSAPYTTRERVFTNRYVGPMKYWIYEPASYTPDPNKKWPMVVFLHGRAETGTNINLLLNSGLPALLKKGANYDAFIVAPQYNDGKYDGISYEEYIVKHLIPHIVEDYDNIDEDRISLTGHSMGANTTVYMAGVYPDFFSCFVPASLCGYSSSQIPTIAKLTVKAFHGGNDSQCGVYNTNKFISEIKKAGGTADAVIFPSAGHVITNAVYSTDTINWMIKQVRGQPRKD